MIERTWTKKVINKSEGTDGYKTLMFEVRTYDADRPTWIDHTMSGAPTNLRVTDEEFAAANIGDEFTMTLRGPQ